MQKRLRPIMFVGTCSDAGKSVINAAFCRIFKQDGYTPAPFKAQNMSLNSYPTLEGGEMGRAQVVQAEACGIQPHTDMNPVLLKPTTYCSSQIIVNGKVWKNQSAREYFGKKGTQKELFDEVKAAFARLEAQYNPIVMEGAGSISELNLKERDITNMRMALAAGAATYLIADIDRGGVFGSVYGTIALLTPEERALLKGIIINKFRGDITLFEEGKALLEQLTGVPVTGIIPWFTDIRIEQEDSVVLDKKQATYREGKINVAVVLLKRMSNFTDFDVLETDPRFNIYYTHSAEEIRKTDILILPGSKNTIGDLQDLREQGLDEAIREHYRKGKKIIGICGGYQMMGEKIEDPWGVEGIPSSIEGLGLVPVNTLLEKEKTTRQTTFRFLPGQTETLCTGYEIHTGRSEATKPDACRPVALLVDGTMDGCFTGSACWGTYLHGILDNPDVRDYLAKEYATGTQEKIPDYNSYKETQYDKLADLVRRHVNLPAIYHDLME